MGLIKRNRFFPSWLTFLIIVIAFIIMFNKGQGGYFQLIGFIYLTIYVPFKFLSIFPEKPKYLKDEFPEDKEKNKRL